MHKRGHTGAALLAYTPLLAWLLTSGHLLAALSGFAVVLGTAMLPDLDLRVPGLAHRGPTHTPVFAVSVGLVVGGIGLLAALPDRIVWVCALAATLTIVSHLVADAITRMGIPHPAWPLRGGWVRLPPGILASSPVANGSVFAGGWIATLGIVYYRRQAIATSIADAVGIGSQGLRSPQSPAEWQAFGETVANGGSDLVIAALRYDYIGGVVIGLMVLVGVVIVSKT